ncbi:MAG TPA: acyl-ACP--UDP-N-acetylglucosamine O-acyltransferase [Candidatus Paceibacterota bacterium]|nr:acyl-ACP--UDP-N-acetylglucosamine O-acyltransferase [Verrucomicrobiota bacterium]HRY47540.1 acyl-ACP--UDP-N-acetylglucosamine O-acyltransferase [Candidatus Paceibacterota bacterium]
MIHPTAIIHPEAVLDPNVDIGPYAVVDAGVVLGAHCWVGPYVHLTGQTRIGSHNRFHAGCVIGDAPQDLKYRGDLTGVAIGDRNVFREQVTVHRSNRREEETVIGSDNYLMAHCHVGHNSKVGNHVIIANGALLGGHVILEDRVNISGNCLVHQFVRVGAFALMQGGSAISKDLPPFTTAWGANSICGLNIVGLRRHGFSSEDRLELKRLYQILFRQGLTMKEAVHLARSQFSSEAARRLVDFVASSKRGVCQDTGRS